MKYKNDKAEDIFQSQAEFFRGEVETIKSDSESDPSWGFDDDISNRDWGLDDNASDCEDNRGVLPGPPATCNGYLGVCRGFLQIISQKPNFSK